MTLWLIIVLIVSLLIFWLLTLSIVLEIDTKLPRATLRCGSFVRIAICYEAEWWVIAQIFFYTKRIRLAAMKRNHKKVKSQQLGIEKKKRTASLTKMIRVIGSFRVEDWQLALDTGDYCLNGKLYPLHFMPNCYKHVYINFADDNFIYLRIKNQPWRILYALLDQTIF
jgi:hypothetical protein